MRSYHPVKDCLQAAMDDKNVPKDKNTRDSQDSATPDDDVIYVNYDARENTVGIQHADEKNFERDKEHGSKESTMGDGDGSKNEGNGASENGDSNGLMGKDSKNTDSDAFKNGSASDSAKSGKVLSRDDRNEDSNGLMNKKQIIHQETVEKWKQRLSFLTPLFASLIINVISGMFFISFLLVVSRIVRDAFDEDAEMVSTVQNTFRVFAAVAAAACAPLIIKYGFRKVALGGSALLIFSCLSSSLTSTADILAIPYGFMGGIALGLVRTTGIVCTLDFLHKRPLLALILSTMCFIVGQIIGIFVFFFEMNQYVTSRRSWPNVMRIFEVTAVIGLLAGCFLPKSSNTQQNVPQVFKHPPFYFILSIRIVATIGLSIVVPSTLSLSQERGFAPYLYTPFLTPILIMFFSQLVTSIILLILRKFLKNQLKRTALVTFGSVVLVIGLATMVHQVAFVHAWPVAVFGLLLGVAQVFDQSMVPLALVSTTGRIVQATSSVDGALYYAGVTMVIGGIGAIVTWVSIKRWQPLEDETLARPFKEGVDNSFTPLEENEEHPGIEE